MSPKRLAPVTALPSKWQYLAAGALFRVQPATPGINIRASALIAQNYNVASII
tara:strand:- start:896 stop:1054 length:159 start_codon:yes stop_codon:yes gene_type:complete